MRKVIIIGIILTLALISYFSFINTSFQQFIFVRSLDKQKEESAERGINWIISQQNVIEPENLVPHLTRLYNVTKNSRFKQRFSKIIAEKKGEIKKIQTSVDLNNNQYLRWNNLQLIIDELLNKKCSGQEYIQDSEKIQGFIASNSKRIFPRNRDLTNKLIAAYLLKELGFDKRDFYKNTISEIRGLSVPKDFSKEYIASLYASTHIIITESGYFVRYLDAKEYQKELTIFNSALEAYSRRELDDSSLDILSEILVSLKLLKIPSNGTTERMSRKIISLQNADGSWGIDKGKNSKTHHTVVATFALMEFAPKLNYVKPYCLAKPLSMPAFPLAFPFN